MNKITIKVIDNSHDFKTLIDEWRQLSIESNANPLFLSWEWQYSWWNTWSETLSLELFLLTAYHDEKLIGVAPLYIDNINIIKGLPIRRLQFIGNAWRKANTVRTEYLEFISCNEYSKEVCEAFLKFISLSDCWDEFLICDLVESSPTYAAIHNKNIIGNWHVFKRDSEAGVNIRTVGDFAHYVTTLGKNMRLKLFNRRKTIEEMGEVNVHTLNRSEVNQFFVHLNTLHQTRWGSDCFSGQSLDFHKSFIAHIEDDNCLELSLIVFEGNVVSALYNIKMGNKVFNLQAGFIEEFNKKISLGTLHLGYSIEQAFNDVKVNSFDLLAGEGKNSFYKERYKGEDVNFLTMQIVRKKRLKYLYKIFFILPKEYRNYLSKCLLSR